MKPAVTVRLPEISAQQYPIFIQAGLLKNVQTWLPDLKKFSGIAIITDSMVAKKYGTALSKLCKDVASNVSKAVHLIQFPAGEKHKNNATKEKIESELFRHQCDRKTLIIALGGGVVGDMVGFVAATYLRGVSYIQVPTTLLAMVDSSVGGKTGMDNSFGKNLIGAFWQPKVVVADLSCLKTLPKKQIVCGLVEAIKMFLTSDAKSFSAIEKNIQTVLTGNESAIKPVITAAVSIKAGVVRRDEKEQGERAILNCGHTIGHALERLSNYQLLHGIAVGLGILVEAKMAEILGILKTKDFIRIQTLFAKLGIHGKDLQKFNVDQVIKATAGDKKSSGGKVRYVLLKKIGAVCEEGGAFTHVVPDRVIREAFNSVETGFIPPPKPR